MDESTDVSTVPASSGRKPKTISYVEVFPAEYGLTTSLTAPRVALTRSPSMQAEGKTRYDLLPPDLLEMLAKVFEMGAEKYTDYGWKSVVQTAEGEDGYVASAYRHLVALHNGETFDAESGLPHAIHLAANGMILAWVAQFKKSSEKNVEHSEHFWRAP
jgi:hypothetical protein